MSTARTASLTIVAGVVVAGVLAAAVLWSGLYPVSATRGHWQVVYGLLDTALRRSVAFWSRDVAVPDLTDPALVLRGAGCFRQHCVQCHGAPGVAQGEIGRGMQPLPGPLVDADQRWQPRELYWITRHGIRMSGMPAWEYRLPDADLWALVAFMQRLPQLSPQDYAAVAGAAAPAAPLRPGATPADHSAASGEAAALYTVSPVAAPAAASTACGFTAAQRDAVPDRAPDVARGRRAMAQYACSACHTIPGVTGSSPQVGPPLAGLATRTLIAGKLAHTPENMVRWLRHPQQVDPLTSMPDLQVTEADARDMAAYLATLR